MEVKEIVGLVMEIVLVLGMVYTAFLLIRYFINVKKTKEGLKKYNEEKNHLVFKGVSAFIAQFLDTVGIGWFLTLTASWKLSKTLDDLNIPGTLNVGCVIPVGVQALLFFQTIEVDITTIVCMTISSVIGSYVGARIVTKLNRTAIRLAMFVGMFIVGIIMVCQQLQVGPFGMVGTETGVSGIKLVVATAVCFVLGGLMNIGVGFYPPCMALVILLGMDATIAFPVMFGACTYLMAFGIAPKFIKEGRFDMFAAAGLAIFGTIGSILCYFTVLSFLKSQIGIFIWVITVIVFITAAMFLKDYIGDVKNKKKAKS